MCAVYATCALRRDVCVLLVYILAKTTRAVCGILTGGVRVETLDVAHVTNATTSTLVARLCVWYEYRASLSGHVADALVGFILSRAHWTRTRARWSIIYACVGLERIVHIEAFDFGLCVRVHSCLGSDLGAVVYAVRVRAQRGLYVTDATNVNTNALVVGVCLLCKCSGVETWVLLLRLLRYRHRTYQTPRTRWLTRYAKCANARELCKSGLGNFSFRNCVDTLTATNAANVNTNTLLSNTLLARDCVHVRAHSWRLCFGC
jgi:hypothetical protein